MAAFFGDLLIITPQVLGGLLLTFLLASFIAVRLLRKHRRRLAASAAVVALLLLPATAADAVNAHFQYLPRVADVIAVPTWPTAAASVLTGPLRRRVARHRHGAVIELALPGSVSGFGTHTALVYLPPQYFTEQSRRFPVLYLIHGSPGAPVDWFRAARAASAGMAAARAGHPVILIAPRASRSWSDDSECVDRPSEHVESYLTRDVVAVADRLLRTVPSREGRAIIGNSAGGFCALNLGLRHREVFSGIGDLSGYDHPTFDGGMAALFGRRPDLSRTAASEDPSQYARGLSSSPRMRIWFDSGRADLLPLREVARLSRVLRRAGHLVVLRERAGGHDYGVWRPALAESVVWLAELLDVRRVAVPYRERLSPARPLLVGTSVGHRSRSQPPQEAS